MTRKEIDKLIKISEGQVEYALRNLRRILEQDEAREQETRWTKLLIGHKDLIEVLKQQKADDEWPEDDFLSLTVHTNEQRYGK